MHPASTTKIVTTMVALEKLKLDEELVSNIDAKQVPGSSLHLKRGEKLSVEDALYATMLRSANDVCHALAFRIAGSDAKFGKLMTEWAKENGASQSTFLNPHGLSQKGHLTTAFDLATIARAAMQHEVFAEIVRTPKRTITRSKNAADTVLLTRNEYLNQDPTADGIKTGYTDLAGRCYVGSATRNGFRVITVILKSKDAFSDHRAMLDWVYTHYRLERTTDPAEPLLQVPVLNGEKETLVATPTVKVPLLARVGAPDVSVRWNNGAISAPVVAGQILGEATVRDSDNTIVRVPVVAAEAIEERKSLFPALDQPNAGRTIALILGGFMLLGAVAFRRKSRRI